MENKFGSTIKCIRNNRNLSLRDLAKLCEFSPAYISDLEKNNRKPSIEVIKRISERLELISEEQKMVMDAFFHDRLEIPSELLHYIIDNDLIESLNILREFDSDGQDIKNLAFSLKNNNSK